MDTTKYQEIPFHVKRLLTNSAGLFVTFKTNSTAIAAKWCVTNLKPLNNLTPIANKGLDLYIKRKDKWVYAGSGRPDTDCSQYVIVNNMNNEEKECLLYLPLYDETKSLEIGLKNKSSFSLTTNPFNKGFLSMAQVFYRAHLPAGLAWLILQFYQGQPALISSTWD